MEDDALCCDVKPWCQRGDYKSAFAINLTEPLFTITDSLQQSVLETLKFPQVVAAKSVSVDGPVRVDNIDQHVRIRSEIIIPTQSLLASLEDGHLQQGCPESSRRPCRDTKGSTGSDGSSGDDECDDDYDDDEEDDEEEEEDEPCEDESNKDDAETQIDCEEDDDIDEEASMKQCSNTGPCRDPPTGRQMPQAPSKFPTEIPVKQFKEKETTEKASAESEAKAECEAKEMQNEIKKVEERTPEEEEELNILHKQCLHLSKEELEVICTKYKNYDKKFKIKRAKSSQTGECKFKLIDKEKLDKRSVGGKQQEEAKTDEGDEYFCQEAVKEKSVVDIEEEEECEDGEEQMKENKETGVNEKEVDDGEDEEYEEDDETERYYGLERPCKAAPIACEKPNKDKEAEPNKECVPPDYSRYDKQGKVEKENDIFYKLSPKFSAREKKPKNSNPVCDDGKRHNSKIREFLKDDQCTEPCNNKLVLQQDTIYYDDKMKQETNANVKTKKLTKEEAKTKQTTKDDVEYFTDKTSEPKNGSKTEEIKPKLCNNEYYASNNNNNNNNNRCDKCEDDGGYFECSDDLVKDDDADSRSGFASTNGGFVYSCSHASEVEDNTNESCGMATAVGQHRQYPKAHSHSKNESMSDGVQPLVSYFCPENSSNQHKYQAYGHSGVEDVDDKYFASTVLPSGEDAKQNKTKRVNFPIFTDTERNYFISGTHKSGPSTFPVNGLAISSWEPLAMDVVSMTSDHFENCKRAFESMKQRAFGDDFEDYFESCLSSNPEDKSETNFPFADTTPPVDQIPPDPVPDNKTFASVEEECEAKRNGFLKSLFGIIGKAGTRQNRKNAKAIPDCVIDTGDGCQISKPKLVEKRFFTFGRYKQKNGEKACNKTGCDAKKPKEITYTSSIKSEKRKFRFGKTVNEKKHKKLDAAGMIESFLAIEKTANRYYAVDEDFEIKNNGYILKSGKLMKRPHTGDATGLVHERSRPRVERQESGDMEGKSAAGKGFSEKAFQTTCAAGDCDHSNEGYRGQTQDHPKETSDVLNKSHAERQDDTRKQELPNEPELATHHELANDVVSGNAQSELHNKMPFGSIEDATCMDSASEINESVDLAGGKKKAYSAPDVNSASVQTIVSDDMSNVDALKTALCGFQVTPSDTKATKHEQPNRKVSSFLVVSEPVNTNALSDTKPYRKLIRRKIVKQEAVIISRHNTKCKESKSPVKSQNNIEIITDPTEAYRPKERRPEINYGKHIHESKSLNRTVFRDTCTARDAQKNEAQPSFDSNSANSPHEKIHNSLITRNEQKARKKYKDTKSSQRNKSANCLINSGPVVDPTCGHCAKEDALENLKSPTIASSSMLSAHAKSDIRLPKKKPNKNSNEWVRKCDLPDSQAAVKTSFHQKQFVNRSVQEERKTPREIYSHKKTHLSKVVHDGNHNVNCGADDEIDDDDDDDDYDDDFGNCQPQTVNNIIFSDKQHPGQHVHNKIEAVSMEANQAFASSGGVSGKIVWDKVILNETAQTDDVCRGKIELETSAAGHEGDKITRCNTAGSEMSADNTNTEQIQMPAPEVSIVNDALNTPGDSQIKTESKDLESNPTGSEIMNAETRGFLLSVGDNTNGDIVESFLNEQGQQQKLYNGELGLVQDCSGSHWEIQPSLRDDYLIVNSKNENVIYHFQSENRPIWKSGDFDDIESCVHEAIDENITRGKYTKYDEIDDGRGGVIFDENQLMRCSLAKTEAVGSQQIKKHGFYNGKINQAAEDYAEATCSSDGCSERRIPRDPNAGSPTYCYTRASSSQKENANTWTNQGDQETNKQADSYRPHCNTCVNKAWRFADSLMKNVGEEAMNSDIWVDGTYTSQWSDGRKWQAANACPENPCEDGKEREFWGGYIYSTVGNCGKTKTPTAVNIASGVEERRDTVFWNSAAYTAANNGETAYVTNGGCPGESKDNDLWASALYSLADNSSDKTQKMEEELCERVGDAFWSDRLYSPTRKGKGNWKPGEETDEKRGNELNAVRDSKINADGFKANVVPARNERRTNASPEKVVEASKLTTNEAEVKAEQDIKITRQYASPTLQSKQFVHLPENYTMKTHKSNTQPNGPVVIGPEKDCPPENIEKPVNLPEASRESKCLKEKPIRVYDICKPTVIKLKTFNADDSEKFTVGKEKRKNGNETVKEKANNATKTRKSSGFRRKVQHINESNNVVLTKDTKKSEVSRKTKHTSTSEAANKIAEAKVDQKTPGKDSAARRDRIGDWFSQEKELALPNVNARRSTKRDSEESHSRDTRSFSSGKQLPPSLSKPENREPGVIKQGREANVARDKVNFYMSKKKTPFQSQSQENINGEGLIYVNSCGDGTRIKKWKLFVVSERKDIGGNVKQHDTELEPIVHQNISKPRESNERALLGSLNVATRQVAGKVTQRPVSAQAQDDLSNHHANGQSRATMKAFLSTSRRTKQQQPEPRKDALAATENKIHDSKTTKESPEQPKKQGRVYKIDLGEHMKLYDHKKSVTTLKDQMNTMDEFGFGQLVQLTSHSRDKDTDKLKIVLGKHDDNEHKINQARVFKMDCEERVSNKSRNRTKDNTARKQKAEECLDNQPEVIEQQKRPVRIVDKDEKNRADTAFFERHRHRHRYQQKSETSVTNNYRVKVENSKSEVMSTQQNVLNNQSIFVEEFKRSNMSRKEECKKLKEEIRRARCKSENKNTNTRRRPSAHMGVEENYDLEATHISMYPSYMNNSCQGDGLNQGESESQQTQDNSGESSVDVEMPPSFDEGRIEFDRRSKASNAKFDIDVNKYTHRQSNEKRMRQVAVKKSRTDTSQTDRFVPTLIDGSVVNTVARAWMDDAERLGINSLQEAKMFSPSVLLHQTSGSPSANCHYISNPMEMINSTELANQQNPLVFGGDYFDLFPRPTFLPDSRYQDMDSGEYDHKTDEIEYAACKLCPANYFSMYKNIGDGSQQQLQQQQQQQQQLGYSVDTLSSQDRDQKKGKTQENSNIIKPYFYSTEKAPVSNGGAVSRSYVNRGDKVAESRKHVSKDDSFITIGHSYNFVNEASVSKFGDKQHKRHARTAKMAETLHGVVDQQTVKQAHERKSVDPWNFKRSSDKSKHIRKIESADDVKSAHENSKTVRAAPETSKAVKQSAENAKTLKLVSETSRAVKPSTETSKTVKPALESSKSVKTAQEHSKTERAFSYKPQMENSQISKTLSENQQGKGHMFSYKVSSKGNRPEVVAAEPKLLAQTEPESQAGVVETVVAKIETVRLETTPEPAPIGLFARILNSLTRATTNQVAAQSLKDDAASKPEFNAAFKPDSSELMTSTKTCDGASVPTETTTNNPKNKPLRSRSPLPTRDAKTLRADYKENTNCNAFVEPSRPNIPIKHSYASSSKSLNKPHRQSLPTALTRAEACIASLTAALPWNAILLIVIFTLYLGTCCTDLLKRYLSCPLPCIWNIVYKFGSISLVIDAFLVSRATHGKCAFGCKGPPTGIFYSFVGKHFSAIFGQLVYAVTLLYTYVNCSFMSAFYRAVIKAGTNLLFLIIDTCNSTLCYFCEVNTANQLSRFGGASIGGDLRSTRHRLKHSPNATLHSGRECT